MGWFARKYPGGQFIEAVDFDSANIAEGIGRYHKKDKIKFFLYSQGSLQESIDWNEKSKGSELINDAQYKRILGELKQLTFELNHLIKFTDKKLTA